MKIKRVIMLSQTDIEKALCKYVGVEDNAVVSMTQHERYVDENGDEADEADEDDIHYGEYHVEYTYTAEISGEEHEV